MQPPALLLLAGSSVGTRFDADGLLLEQRKWRYNPLPLVSAKDLVDARLFE